jgi:hypothetical protein
VHATHIGLVPEEHKDHSGRERSEERKTGNPDAEWQLDG